MKYKTPESILVVIYCQSAQRCLMLQRKDDANFWQSVTGSMEAGEKPIETAMREVQEETGINIRADKLPLIDAQHTVVFEIYPQFRHRYAPNITHNTEHWFYLNLPTIYPIILTEHDSYKWLSYHEAAQLTKSANNSEAILRLLTR